ncbi:hypothetical protein VTJ83DRAFT_836 [Remersonia thermophila]|uniref:Phosphodiesterase n=1 Tax=Remersonia thermophila TaxID=72144 RepID=A0ABR4DME3_9PEZI
MENVACNVIYVDRSVSQDRHVRARDPSARGAHLLDQTEPPHVAKNVKLLLEIFDGAYLCSTGGSGLAQWLSLQENSMPDIKPTLFLIDTPYHDDLPKASLSRPPSPMSLGSDDADHQDEELYGLALLRRILSESYLRNMSKLVVTIPVIASPYADRSGDDDNDDDDNDDDNEQRSSETGSCPVVADGIFQRSAQDRKAANKRMLRRCLDLGATDVLPSPMDPKCVTILEVHAYRAHLDASRERKSLMELRRGRTRSWVGISEEKPFAYLREAMVSKLMSRICRIGNETDDVICSAKLSVSIDKQTEIANAVGRWHFCAHDFTDDELVVAALVMFKHALAMPELEPWRIPTDQLHRFLLSCRAAYNTFVPYHNFRHVVDVLQATFHFLICIGALPPYRFSDGSQLGARSTLPLGDLVQPFEALTLLITAIGHDVGHPGVNNGFLVTLNAPLAQLYNDRSVLESFHCAAYSQILRRHWPAAFSDTKMRNLMISSILSTDMGLHFDYMEKLRALQDMLRTSPAVNDWTNAVKTEQKALLCALLIKCADISNVARRHDTAIQWMYILSDEFSRQDLMERELEIKSSLMSKPTKDLLALSTSQLKFMDMFAIPLFEGVADILPGMQYCVDELLLNKDLFDQCLEAERARVAAAQPPPLDLAGESAPTVVPNLTVSPEAPAGAQRTMQSSVENPDPNVIESRASDLTPVPDTAPRHTPSLSSLRPPTDGRMVNGIVTSFPSPPPDLGHHGEPFHVNGGGAHQGHSRQRCSEATDGSSAPNSGDWASQATSATTGRMPISPSTQGTSIVSRDSYERLNRYSIGPSAFGPRGDGSGMLGPGESTMTVPESTLATTAMSISRSHPDLTKLDHYPPPPPIPLDDDNGEPWRNGNFATSGATKNGSLDPSSEPIRQLKKKPSRFRINGLQNLFRKHKSSSPPMQAADIAG